MEPAPHRPGDDLSPLAWVHGELRRSLESAHKALRRYLKESEALEGSDVGRVDPSVLRGARSNLHQSAGALELVGLPQVAAVLRASEAAVQRLIARPPLANAAAADTIERASFAVLDFLARQLAGKPVSPVMLFPQYRAAQELAAADRVHPADLWPFDPTWHELPAEPGVVPRPSDDRARGEMEALVLALMRGGDAAALARTSDLCATLAAGTAGREATLWRLASAVFEAQANGRLTPDVYTKRLASRLLAQLRLAVGGRQEVSDRLTHDLLFFCAHAAQDGEGAPRLAAVRRAWRLDAHPSADYETARLGRFDPARIALARKRVAGAKEAWSAVAAGELHRVGILGEQFALVGESLGRLFAAGDDLARALEEAVELAAASAEPPPASLAMEVATAMLYVDASLEDGELDQPDVAARVRRLAQRIDEVRRGAAVQPLESWMEELYRRVSDRQTMGSVVQELRASLSEIEKQVDQYFRNPADRQVLIPVPAQFSAMRGVLSVLGLEQASQAVLRMRDDVDALAQNEADPQQANATGAFDHLADNLGTLGFLIDMLSVQPVLVKSLFRFDPATGSLAAVMCQGEPAAEPVAVETTWSTGQVPAAEPIAPLAAAQPIEAAITAPVSPEPPWPVEAAAVQAAEPAPAPAMAAVPLTEQVRSLLELASRVTTPDGDLERRLDQLSQQAFAADEASLARAAGAARSALRMAADTGSRAAARAAMADALAAFAPAAVTETAAPPAPPPRTTPAAAPGGTGLEDDAEMREIFIEEAREVVAQARLALDRLVDAPENATDMTAVRRAFHTLKGSSRMVGLRDFGEAAWACEQLYNARLAQSPRLDTPLRLLTGEALAYFGDWVEAMAAARDDGHRSESVAQAADALRLHGRRLAIEAPLPPVPEKVPEVPEVSEVPEVPEVMEVPEASEISEVLAVEAGPSAALPPIEPPPIEALPLADVIELPVDRVAEALPADEVPLLDEVVEVAAEPVAEPMAGPVAEPVPEPVPESGAADEAPGLPFELDLGPATTRTIGAREPVPATEPEGAGLDFELEWPEAAPTAAAAPVPQPLTARVPDLPSASDLDLGGAGAEPFAPHLPAPPPPEVLEPVDAAAAPEELTFELDLGPLADEGFEAAAATAPALPVSAPDLADLPAVSESIEAGEAAEPALDLEPEGAVGEPLLPGAIEGQAADAGRAPPSEIDLPLEIEQAAPLPVPDVRPVEGDMADFDLEAPALAASAQADLTLPLPASIELTLSAPTPLPETETEAEAEAEATSSPARVPAGEPPAEPTTAVGPELVEEGAEEAAEEVAAEEVAGLFSEGAAEELTGILGEEPIEEAIEEPIEEARQELVVEPGEAAVPAETVLAAPAAASVPEEESTRVIGPLRIPIPLFNIFLNEADEQSRRLGTELAEWSVEAGHHPVPEGAIALAHSLAGNSATVGYADLSALARALEHALERSRAVGQGRIGEEELFVDAAEEIRRLLHQFAAGFLRPAAPMLIARLADHERWPAVPAEPASAAEPAIRMPAPAVEPALREEAGVADLPDMPEPPVLHPVVVSDFAPLDLAPEPIVAAAPGHPMAPTGPTLTLVPEDDEQIDAVDAVDADLFPIFEEEALELLPQLQSRLREWHDRPADGGAAMACMRTLHTFKGGARLAGAMRLGEMAHRLETAIERLAAHRTAGVADVDPVLTRADAMASAFDVLRMAARATAAAASAPAAVPSIAPAAERAAAPAPTLESRSGPLAAGGSGREPAPEVASVSDAGPEPRPEPEPAAEAAAPAETAPAVALLATAIDWGRFDRGAAVPTEAALRHGPADGAGVGGAHVRVRASLLDRLVNAAGEVSITRERIVADTKQLHGSLEELTESLERMRRQLRDIELQAETQIASRMELARAAGEGFDPLEMDRFTRFQELTRFMAESVNDVATLQRSLQRTLQSTEDELAAQARLTRDLQDDLLRTRMVEFESLAERLYRTVRQAAKESGKQVRLDLVGGAIEIDRGVLERMVGSFEHLLRNCVVHGIEGAARRAAAGKDPVGLIQVQVAQSGNEVAVEFADDGGGFDFERIRGRAVDRGLLAADSRPAEAELAQLLFEPGFSTAEGVTELAGRGVGLDVVRSEVNAMGGRIETASAPGQGTRFRLLLPLTTAVTQVVMLRCGALRVGVPSTLVEGVRRVSEVELGRACAGGALEHGGELLPFFWLGALLQSGVPAETAVGSPVVVVVRSAEQRVAVQVDEVLGNQEVVVKNVGPQLARLPGLAGVTLLPSGAVALIYNPVALASLYAVPARRLMHRPASDAAQAAAAQEPAPPRAPLVLVVDDSLTVRRVMQRLLLREGYRVAIAKDGLEALERLAEERPVVLLSDIEMPRMDGFDLVRNVRADRALADLPVVMITSRIAQKHRDYAAELGVSHYLGKPFSEEELLALVARYAGADIEA